MLNLFSDLSDNNGGNDDEWEDDCNWKGVSSEELSDCSIPDLHSESEDESDNKASSNDDENKNDETGNQDNDNVKIFCYCFVFFFQDEIVKGKFDVHDFKSHSVRKFSQNLKCSAH